MSSNIKIVSFTWGKKIVDVYDALGKLLGQHDVEVPLDEGGASVQEAIAAMAVYIPHYAVYLMDLKAGKVFFKFILPDGEFARVALSKDTLTMGVGSSTGVS